MRRPHSRGLCRLLADGASAEAERSGSDVSEDRAEPIRRSCSALAAAPALLLLRSRLATSSMMICACSPARHPTIRIGFFLGGERGVGSFCMSAWYCLFSCLQRHLCY